MILVFCGSIDYSAIIGRKVGFLRVGVNSFCKEPKVLAAIWRARDFTGCVVHEGILRV